MCKMYIFTLVLHINKVEAKAYCAQRNMLHLSFQYSLKLCLEAYLVTCYSLFFVLLIKDIFILF